MLFNEIVPIYIENCTKYTNSLCVQNAELLDVKAGATKINQLALKL
jgi:hypothetical protein